ncbi:TnsA endonuclease N-terminal domain-containing protein, partial [Streptococcus suis]
QEQYPLLPIEETIIIANELGIKHPTDLKSGEPIVMTTDFLVTTRNNTEVKKFARTLKYKNELMDKRVLEKFEIERVFWERQEVDWGIVTELEVPNPLLAFPKKHALFQLNGAITKEGEASFLSILYNTGRLVTLENRL